MSKELIKGIVLGIVAPVIAFLLFVVFFLEQSVSDTLPVIIKINKLTHVISLSVLINLALFFLLLKFNKERMAKGILLATFLYTFFVVILKFIG